jgi:hypothetical protein
MLFVGNWKVNKQKEARKMKIKGLYENGECPDCGEAILDDVIDGSECKNCNHVFTTLKDDD